MSHALGIVYDIERERTLGYFEYNGTCDFAMTAVRTEEEIDRDWRTDANNRECVCAEPVEQPVILHSTYGGGFDWESTVCARCMTITGRLSEHAVEDEPPWPGGFG